MQCFSIAIVAFSIFLQTGAHHDGLWARSLPVLQWLPSSPILSVVVGMELDVVDYFVDLNLNELIWMLPHIVPGSGPH